MPYNPLRHAFGVPPPLTKGRLSEAFRQTVYFIATQIILTIRKKENYQFKINEWIIIASAFIITLTIGFSIYTLVIGNTLEEYIYVIIAVLLSLLDVIIFVFMGKINRVNQKEMEKQKLQTQLSHQQNEIEQLEHQ